MESLPFALLEEMEMSKRFLAVLGCLVLLVPIFSVSAFDGTDFSGTWKINPGQSEMGGGGRGGGGRGGGRGRGRGMGQAPEMVVTQDGNSLNISQGPNEYKIEIGGEATTVEGPRGPMTVAAKWDGAKLVVNRTSEFQTQNGAMIIEETQGWELSGDGKLLTQQVERTTPRGTQTQKMVFDKQ